MPEKQPPVHNKATQLEAKERVKGWIDKPEHETGDDESTRNGELPIEEGEPAMTDLDAQVKVTVPDPEPEPDVKVEVDVETPAEPTDENEKEEDGA